ncbi:hypothetical protein [Methylobacter sp. S3L5C]|uniref:hypothetical protein n=1 Tax=Methylobacter sp. S3L5C TaxID=2839024 RepID=UPI001FAB4299|nr:hypothetical protein [Methylobacter sp. S3L5C]UOA10236.1 hypothetical protein KKZ03_08385 [Methylobacter sp. S3L5C]
MSNPDYIIHITGAVLLMVLGLLWQRIDSKYLQRMVSNLFVLVLGMLLVDVFVHLLPNTLADFIYRTHKHAVPGNFRSGQ